jgi:hypothetical protein
MAFRALVGFGIPAATVRSSGKAAAVAAVAAANHTAVSAKRQK